VRCTLEIKKAGQIARLKTVDKVKFLDIIQKSLLYNDS